MKKLIIITLILLTYSINAQEPVRLDTVVLKGVRADAKTPVSAKTVKSDEIQQTYSGQEMSIILDKTPSITSNSDGGHPQGYTYFRLRGIDQTRINMTLNGVPLNEPEDQGVYFSNLPNFAKNIKSMQIQRGVGTSTNGVSSFAGSINFITPRGLKEKINLEAEYGSYDTKRFNFNYESGLVGNNISTYLNVSYFDTDGYKYHSGSKGFSVLYATSYYGDKSTVTLTTLTGASKNQMSWLAVSEDDIKVNPKTNYNHPDAEDDFNQTLIMLEYKTRFNSTNKLRTSVFYNRLEGDWDLYTGDMLNFRLDSHFYGIISNYNISPKNFDINLGLSANGYLRNHSMVILPNKDRVNYLNTGKKNEVSTYGKINYDLGPLTLFGDIQYRYVTFNYEQEAKNEVAYPFKLSTQNWSFLNPKIGLTYNINNSTKLYTSVGKANREPTRSDMFGGEDDLVTFVDVTPEEVLDYEFGVRHTSDKIHLEGNLYYMDFQNEITLLGSLGSYSLQQFGNVDKSYRAGIEIDLAWRLHDKITLKYNGSFSDNKIKDQGVEFEPLYTPKAIQNLAFNLHKNGGFIEISGKHHSESYLDFANKNVTPSFITMNLDIGHVGKKYDFKVKVINLTSEEYFTNGYMDGGVRHFYVNAPISVYASLKYKF